MQGSGHFIHTASTAARKVVQGQAVYASTKAAVLGIRATFYDHYTDKFALFEAMVAGDFLELLNERNIRFDRNLLVRT